MLASQPAIWKFENPYRARDAVTFFEPQPSERGSLRERGVQAHPLWWKGSLKRLRDPHLEYQVQTGPDTRHNGRGSLFPQGAYEVPIKLAKDIATKIKVTVAAEEAA